MSAVRILLEDQVLRLTLARPEKKNALTGAMYEALAGALVRAESDPQVHVVLFDAEGDSFSAGNDLTEFAAVASGAIEPSALKVRTFLDALATATLPYVAAVQGAAVGIGTTLLLHCDLVYLGEDAQLSTPFVNLALVPEAASSVLLPERIGHARAFALFALGETLDAQRAVELGLANAVLPSHTVREHALAQAKALAKRPVGALRATKQLMRDAAAIRAVMAREIEMFSERLRSEEALTAFKAFAARKRD
ncbi:MAG: enoyl-CoA hydratase-related protein [Gammaproteobacteria bacterium]|nr:enoyl-CoA hydratase [Gammaproteobacteria bacterium]